MHEEVVGLGFFLFQLLDGFVKIRFIRFVLEDPILFELCLGQLFSNLGVDTACVF
jgi:hypothetical protein